MRNFNGLAITVVILISVLQLGCTRTGSETERQQSVKTETSSKQELSSNRSHPEMSQADDSADKGESESTGESPITLHVGDPAPPLQIAYWVQGAPVDVFETDHVYVVEFWATWCGPCKASMPHISKLQEEYSEKVTFVGISDEEQQTVDDFFASKGPGDKTWNEIVKYAIALDTAERDTHSAYMNAAGQGGIPTAFVVGKDGQLEWIGHPAGIDEPLRRIVEGSWDRDQFALQLVKQQKRQSVIMEAMTRLRAKKYEEGLEIFKTLVDDDWDNPDFLNGVAWMAVADIPAESTDLAWAEKVALRASELTNNQNASILDTVARVYYERKNLQAAIEWQQKAVDLSDDASLAKTLKSYLKERDGDADDTSEAVDADQADDQASSPQ